MRLLPLVLLLACEVSPDGPATPGSPSAEHAQRAAEIARQAAEVEALAATLESEVDEGRRRMEKGESTAEQEVAKYRELMSQIEARDAELQASVRAWEEALPVLAGAPPAAAPLDVPAAAPPRSVTGPATAPTSAPATAPAAAPASPGIRIEDPASEQQGAPVPR